MLSPGEAFALQVNLSTQSLWLCQALPPVNHNPVKQTDKAK